MENQEITLHQGDGIQLMEASQRAEIDVQISTAKEYPRELSRVITNSKAIVTMDIETAQTCGYAVPRSGKNISGPSVHLARIIAAEYGNLRVEAKIINITETQVVSQAVCFDLEKNYAVKVEVRKSIVGKKGRYNEDMITVTGNAANAIAYRNAVFAVIPKSVTDGVYRASVSKITGDLSDEDKLIAKRKKVIDQFNEGYGVKESELLKFLGLNTINQIKADQIVQLYQLAQSLKDGDTTVEDAFERKSEEQIKKEAAAAKTVDKVTSAIKSKTSQKEMFNKK